MPNVGKRFLSHKEILRSTLYKADQVIRELLLTAEADASYAETGRAEYVLELIRQALEQTTPGGQRGANGINRIYDGE